MSLPQARPVRHRPRPRLPGRRLRAAARARERRVRAVRWALQRTAEAASQGELPFPHLHVVPRRARERSPPAARYRAVVCPTGGRLAPLASWAGARRARIPLILWASLWAHPRSLAHAVSYLPLRRLYRSADAVVTYGPHVSAYVRARGARNVHVAPQSVDNDFWGSPAGARAAGGSVGRPSAATRFLFVGRAAREKGLERAARGLARVPLRRAGRRRSCSRASARRPPVWIGDAGAAQGERGRSAWTRLAPEALRDVYAACDVLVLPSIATRTFREPWGLVVNEAMNRRLPVIASDAVGAAAGGLVQDGRQRTGRSGGRRRRARAGDRDGSPRTPSCGRAWARRARATCAPTATRPGPRASRGALASVGASSER